MFQGYKVVNKMTFRYNFPDIFFDTTSSTSLFDDNHRFDRFDRFVGESFKDHGLVRNEKSFPFN